MVKKDPCGYQAKYEAKFRVFLKIYVVVRQKMQGFMHIFKFSLPNSEIAELQNPCETEQFMFCWFVAIVVHTISANDTSETVFS